MTNNATIDLTEESVAHNEDAIGDVELRAIENELKQVGARTS